MRETSLRTASIYCLVIWAAIWVLFMLIRFSPLDIRIVPGIGPFMLLVLVVALVAPIVAIGLAGAALVRGPRTPRSWMVLGCAIAALFGQGILFAVTRWL
jgi:predicted ABC-type exoprotein transport system permease subunit